MLVSFSVSNFRSFLKEQTFSMVANSRLVDHPSHLVPIPNSTESVLRAGIIYGANGAGKTNLFKAMDYLRQVVRQPRENAKTGTGRQAFVFSEDKTIPSTFDVQFIANNKLYRFGFSCDDSKITDEWLIEVIGKQEKVIYERVTREDGTVQVESELLKKLNDKFAALITIGGPQNQSFLATSRATLNMNDLGEEITAIIYWFDEHLNLVAPDDEYAPLAARLSEEAGFLDFAGQILKTADTGIDGLSLTEKKLSAEEIKAVVPKKLWNKFVETSREGDEPLGLISRGSSSTIMKKPDEDSFRVISIDAVHKPQNGNSYPLALQEESDGTRRLLELIPALNGLQTAKEVYFIDEIDRHMHPMLVYQLIEFFLKNSSEKSGQLIATTHAPNLLDQDLLRRDEIWFSEKDNNLETRLYSLSDFKVRTDLEIQKNYLNGRFGAIPFLANLAKLSDS